MGTSIPFEAPAGAADDLGLLDAYSQAVIGVVERVGPAVVRVDTTQPATPRTGRRRRGAPLTGAGSGVVFATDGLMLTNSHVVAGAGRIDVTTVHGERVRAEGRSRSRTTCNVAGWPMTDSWWCRVPREGIARRARASAAV